jgi:hypothetical protein
VKLADILGWREYSYTGVADPTRSHQRNHEEKHGGMADIKCTTGERPNSDRLYQRRYKSYTFKLRVFGFTDRAVGRCHPHSDDS